MLTNFQAKLMTMCSVLRTGDRHWILTGSRLIQVPGLGVVTIKRAYYAAFIGDVPEDVDVFAACGEAKCVCPTHLDLRKARTRARALALPDAVKVPRPKYYQKADPIEKLPKNVTPHDVSMVKYLTKNGNSLAQIRNATNLSVHEIMKIRGGRYDKAAKGAVNFDAEASPPPSNQTPVPAILDYEYPAINEDGLTEQEREWLKTVGRG
jgi:hypothetical protein